MRNALIGALVMAAISTLGDFIWAEGHLRHRQISGLLHGLLLFLCIGLYFGALERRPVRGAMGGAAIGLVAAATFYVLYRTAGYSVMFFIWAFIWIALAVLVGRVLRQADRTGSWSNVLVRGVIAAVGSGVAFYLISGIWRPFDPRGWDYAVHYVAWTFAYLPGFVALMAGPKGPALRT
jgi:hypothetical protein